MFQLRKLNDQVRVEYCSIYIEPSFQIFDSVTREDIFQMNSLADAHFNTVGFAASFERLEGFVLVFRHIADSPK